MWTETLQIEFQNTHAYVETNIAVNCSGILDLSLQPALLKTFQVYNDPSKMVYNDPFVLEKDH